MVPPADGCEENDMATLGELTRQDDGAYTGELRMLSFHTQLRMVPITRPHDKAPDFRLYGRSPNGKAVDVGAAWTKTGRETGETYVSLKIDIPELPQVYYATLGRAAEQDDPDCMAIIWNRPDAGR
jgi:uncharacterized protein (DUF736 family)